MIRHQLTDEDRARIVAMYNAGAGANTVARLLGVSTYKVERFLRERGLMRRRAAS